MANDKLVTFREDGLKQFIKLIRTGMNSFVKTIRAGTINNASAAGYITIEKGDGTKSEVKVGNAVSISGNTITIDGSTYNIGGFIPGVSAADSNDSGYNVWTVKKIPAGEVSSTNTQQDANLKARKVYGSVYNDYAEYRITSNNLPGECVIEQGDGTLIKSCDRLQLGANIISDTFGFSIGETEFAKTPVAVCGRVLAYPFEDIKYFTPGAAVCSGPNGTISLMTREEIKEWPDAIVGYVSEIPSYDTWGADNVLVNGRIWIKIK